MHANGQRYKKDGPNQILNFPAFNPLKIVNKGIKWNFQGDLVIFQYRNCLKGNINTIQVVSVTF